MGPCLFIDLFSNILVPLDGSKPSEKALKSAIDIARKYQSKLLLLHVVSPIVEARWSTPAIAAAQKEREKIGRRILSSASKQAASFGIELREILVHGNPAEQILKASDTHQAALIVIGSRGLSGIKTFFIGSVSSRVCRYAKCPVLLVK